MAANDQSTAHFLEQLRSVESSYRELGEEARYDDLSDLGVQVAQRLTTRSLAAVERAAGRDSVYFQHMQDILAREHENDFGKLAMLIGIVESLSADLEAGYLTTFSELIHGELFDEFLDMSEFLLEEGYKDPAAVVAGASLESHLRQLCTQHDIATQLQTETGLRPKKADLLNSELAKAQAISKLDQKSVTAWLDLRNKAAHGHYTEYSKDQVSLMLAGIRDFITRTPA